MQFLYEGYGLKWYAPSHTTTPQNANAVMRLDIITAD